MTEQEWKELIELSKLTSETANNMQKTRFRDLMEKTREVFKHPTWYEGYCNCKHCEENR